MNIGKEMARLAYKALDEKKAMDIKIIDIHCQRREPEPGSGHG